MKEKLNEKIGIIANWMGNNSVLQSISQGIMGILPIIIVGAFGSLFSGLPIEGYQNFIAQTGIQQALVMVVNATTNLLGVFITISIARVYAKRKEMSNLNIISLLTGVLYFLLLPSYINGEGAAFLNYEFLGTQGMIIGILIAFFAVNIYKWVISKNITIKMPEGTPPFVSNSFVALIPAFLIVIAGIIIRMVFSFTSFGSAFNFVYTILQAPLTNLIGNNIWSVIFMTTIAQIVFSFGIHPGFIQGMLAPILFGLDAVNQQAFASGQALPNIIGMAFLYITTTAVFYPALSVGTIIGAKSERLKTVGKIAMFPAFFGISESLVFGLPIVFNPILIIPYILIPALNLLIAYGLTSIGLVAHCTGVTVFNIPMIFTGFINGSLSIVLMEIGLFILDVLLFIPFIKMQDKVYLDEERGAENEMVNN